MIQFKYKKFAEAAQSSPAKKGPSKLGTAMDFGFAGLTGAGMISAHKQHGEFMEQSKQGLAEMEQQTREINKRLDEVEKEFAIPLAAIGTVANVGMMGGSMIQSSSQNKDQQEMNEQQVAAQDRQTQALQRQNALLKRIEQNGEGGERARRVVETRDFSIMSERLYGVNMSGVTTAIKDLWNAGKGVGVKKSLVSGVKFGLGTGAAAYGANKIISHDMKKSGLDIDETGNLVQKQKSYTSSASTAQKATETAAKKSGKSVFKTVGGKILGPTTVAAFEAPRVFGYFGEKKALMNQVQGTQAPGEMQQQSYSDTEEDTRQKGSGIGKKLAIGAGVVGTAALGFMGARKGKFGKTIQNKPFFQTPGKTISGGILKGLSFETLNTKKVQDIAKNLSTNAKSDTMRKVGNWAQNHRALANTALIIPGAAAGTAAFGLGEKIVKKPMEKIDPDAYKYQKVKDTMANSQPG